jgi:hypothetical protein
MKQGTPSERTPYKARVSMSRFDVAFNILMILGAGLVFLKIKKLVTWDWVIVLAPVCIAVLIKILFIFLNRA